MSRIPGLDQWDFAATQMTYDPRLLLTSSVFSTARGVFAFQQPNLCIWKDLEPH